MVGSPHPAVDGDPAQLTGELIDLGAGFDTVVRARKSEADAFSFRHALAREAIESDLLGRERWLRKDYRRVLHALELLLRGQLVLIRCRA